MEEKTKLTLRPSRKIIDLAHQMAKEENTSITQMFSAFIMARHRIKSIKTIPAGPLTRSVLGVLKVNQDFDYKKEVEDILDAKYGLK